MICLCSKCVADDARIDQLSAEVERLLGLARKAEAERAAAVAELTDAKRELEELRLEHLARSAW